jgi:hypothetical protein
MLLPLLILLQNLSNNKIILDILEKLKKQRLMWRSHLSVTYYQRLNRWTQIILKFDIGNFH